MKYNITLKTEKHFQYIVEADNIENAIKKAKDVAAWDDFSMPENFDVVSEKCREATENDIVNLREFIIH